MREEKQKIHAVLILEIIGTPQKFLMETLENLITQMGQEQGVSVKNKSIKEPKLMEERAGIANAQGNKVNIEHKDFYITFAEVELEADTLFNLVFLMFKYMPAHVEIITPETISIANHSWNDILNDLMRKLHGYDEIARVLQVEKAVLENQLKEFTGNKEIKEVHKKIKQKKKKK